MATTKLPTTLIADGTPHHFLVRGQNGLVIEQSVFSLINTHWGLTLEYVDSNHLLINAGATFGNGVTGILPTNMVKTLASWTSGNNGGGLDTGTITNAFYYVFVIINTNNVSDILFSLSATAPMVPAGWTRVDRIGAVYVNGDVDIEPFIQVGSYFGYVSPIHVDYRSLGSAADANALYNRASSYNVIHIIPNQIDVMARVSLAAHSSDSGSIWGCGITSVQPTSAPTVSPVTTIGLGMNIGAGTANENVGGPSYGVVADVISIKTNTWLHRVWTSGVCFFRTYTMGFNDLYLESKL